MFTSRMKGAPAAIDPEIDARIAVDPEQIPTGDGKPVQLGGKLGLVPLEPKSARRTVKRLAAGSPFGVVIGDQRLSLIEALEHGLADRQQLDPVWAFHHRRGEFPPVDIAFREMLGVPAQRPLGDGPGGVRAQAPPSRDRCRASHAPTPA